MIEEAKPSARCRLLVVDDEPPNLRVFRRAFATDYEVITAEDCASALDVLTRLDVDVLITDQTMPDGTGVELVAEARRRRPDLPALMITGYPDSPEVIRAHQDGLVFRVIVKPWDRTEVQQWIAHLLQLRSVSELGTKLES